MKTLKKITKSLFDGFNIFHSPFNFFIDSKPSLSSNAGSLVSILIFSFLLFMFINSDMIKHKNPKISDQFISNPTSEIVLNNKNFAPVLFMYELIEEGSKSYPKYLQIDPSYVTVSVTHSNSNGTVTKMEAWNSMHDCNISD